MFFSFTSLSLLLPGFAYPSCSGRALSWVVMVCVVLLPSALLPTLFIPAPPPPTCPLLSLWFGRSCSLNIWECLLSKTCQGDHRHPCLQREGRPRPGWRPAGTGWQPSSARGCGIPETHSGLSLWKKMILLQAGGTILGNIFMCSLECTFYAQLRQK